MIDFISLAHQLVFYFQVVLLLPGSAFTIIMKRTTAVTARPRRNLIGSIASQRELVLTCCLERFLEGSRLRVNSINPSVSNSLSIVSAMWVLTCCRELGNEFPCFCSSVQTSHAMLLIELANNCSSLFVTVLISSAAIGHKLTSTCAVQAVGVCLQSLRTLKE